MGWSKREAQRAWYVRNREKELARKKAQYLRQTGQITLRYWRGLERRSTLHATMRPTQRDLGWAAGFLEGEGSFHPAHGSGAINAVQVQREPLDLLLTLFGGSVRLFKRQRIRDKPTWTWYVSGTRARGVMQTLYPLMSDRRRKQIVKVLRTQWGQKRS